MNKTTPEGRRASAIYKLLGALALLALLAGVTLAQMQFGGVYVPPGSSGTGGGAGSITNLSPYSATMYRNSLIVSNATNFTRTFNMFDGSQTTNMEANLSTGGIKVTNDGNYYLSANVIWRQNTNQNGAGVITATNIFGVTTNAGSVGTNLTPLIGIMSNVRTNNQFWNLSLDGLVYLPANTFVGFGYFTIGQSGTNDVAFEKVSLSVTLTAGSTFGNGGGAGNALTNNETRDVNLVNNVRIAGKTTNVLHLRAEASASFAGPVTNSSGVYNASTVTNTGATGLGGTVLHTSTMRGTGQYTNTAGIIAQDVNFVAYDGADYCTFGAINGGIDTSFPYVFISPRVYTPGEFISAGVTPSRPAYFNAQGVLTNASGTPDGTKFLRDDGALAVPPGGGSGGGTNFPPVVHLFAGTNVTVGTGVRQYVTTSTNGTMRGNFQGTPRNGETIRWEVNNTSAGTIYFTNYQNGALANVYDFRAGANVTVFPILANSVSLFEFTFHTNWNGTLQQQLDFVSSQQYSLLAGGLNRSATNNTTVTQYPAYWHDYIDASAFITNATNWAATLVISNGFQGATPQVWYEFTETATNQVYFRLTAPQAYSGGALKAKFHWTSLNVTALKTSVWAIAVATITSTDFDSTTAYGTAAIVRDDHTAGKEYNLTAATADITPGGTPAAGKLMGFRVMRDPNSVDDIIAGVCRLHAVEIQWPLTSSEVTPW